MRVAISGSPVSTRRIKFKSRTASMVLRWRSVDMPLGLARLTIGSPEDRKGTPWKLVGRKPLDQLAAPPRGPRGPDWRTTKPGRSAESEPMPYVTHAPMLGRPEIVVPVFMKSLAGAWLKTSVAQLLT